MQPLLDGDPGTRPASSLARSQGVHSAIAPSGDPQDDSQPGLGAVFLSSKTFLHDFTKFSLARASGSIGRTLSCCVVPDVRGMRCS